MWDRVREAGEGLQTLPGTWWLWGEGAALCPPKEGRTCQGISEGPVRGHPSLSTLAFGALPHSSCGQGRALQHGGALRDRGIGSLW